MKNPFIDSPFRLTSTYGARTLNGVYSNHKGIDLVGVSSHEVCTVIDGTVVSSTIVTDKRDLTWEWGNYVCVHGDDGKYIYYCHLLSRAVKNGERVKAGQKIGVMGNTGNSYGAHLHFEVRLDDRKTATDPCTYLGIENKVGTYDIESADASTEVESEKPSDWAKEAVEWAKDAGILLGNKKSDGGTEYKYKNTCTREEVMVFLYRFREYLENRK